MSALSEALRYMGSGDVAETRCKAEKALAMLREVSPPKCLYRVFSLESVDGGYELSGSGIILRGSSVERMLHGCHSAAIMICSLGFGFEAELRKAQARSMADALILDACGSALVEEGCDNAELEISAAMPGKHLTDRFSPGYGDLPLAFQQDIFAVLDVPRRIGVSLNASLLMSPSKSVTAIVGIKS